MEVIVTFGGGAMEDNHGKGIQEVSVLDGPIPTTETHKRRTGIDLGNLHILCSSSTPSYTIHKDLPIDHVDW
ncbi:hypothetical protein Tco_0796482 [Tanacetum coccineum]